MKMMGIFPNYVLKFMELYEFFVCIVYPLVANEVLVSEKENRNIYLLLEGFFFKWEKPWVQQNQMGNFRLKRLFKSVVGL